MARLMSDCQTANQTGLPSVVVPDLHGCPQFLDWVLREYPGRHLILLGDLINRGADSRGVLRRALALAHEGRATLLWGNHEHWAWNHTARLHPAAQAQWLRARAGELLASYEGDAQAVVADLQAFTGLAQPYAVEGAMLCAHAARPSLGRTPGEVLDKGHLWERIGVELRPLPHYLFPGVRYSVHGHTTISTPIIDLTGQGVVYLDLGSAKTGQFCVWDAATEQVNLYPQ